MLSLAIVHLACLAMFLCEIDRAPLLDDLT
jgi:hypothetical protein